MGLARRIIPAILCRGRTLYKGQGFDAWRSVGAALQALRIHAQRGVDEILLLDISATAESRTIDPDLVHEFTQTCFSPITVGGGVRNVEDVRTLLHAGADKVAMNICRPGSAEQITLASMAVGAQAIVAIINHVAKRIYPAGPSGYVYNEVVLDAAKHMEKLGVGEILLNSVNLDGTMQGYDLEVIREVSKSVPMPVVAMGGCGEYEHMSQAIKAGASAVAAGAMFLFTEATPKGAAMYLQKQGIEVRI
jgi:imidazole glycerol-phosphate synthase subunit HisF